MVYQVRGCIFNVAQIKNLTAHEFRNSELCIKIIWNYNSNVFYNIGTGIYTFRKVIWVYNGWNIK